MPFSQWILLNIPSFVLCLLIVGITVAFSVIGILIVRRLTSHDRLKHHHEAATPIFGTIGVVYAVMLAFIVVTVWQNFDKSNSNVQREANCVADLYGDAKAFPSRFRIPLQEKLREYVHSVVKDEWKTLAAGQASPGTEISMRQLWALYISYQPRTATEQVFFSESIRKLNELNELRSQRIMDSGSALHPLLWFVLITGAIETIAFTFLFGTQNLKAQIIMGVMLAIIVGLLLFIIIALDFPFTGDISVSSEPFQKLLLD